MHAGERLGVNRVFASRQVEERKELYVSSFDIVLIKDETMDVPNAILRYIISPEMTRKMYGKNMDVNFLKK